MEAPGDLNVEIEKSATAAEESGETKATSFTQKAQTSHHCAIEVEHFIGYQALSSGASPFFHPNGTEYICCAGAAVVCNHLDDPHKQTFLRGHKDVIVSLDLSISGKLIASGERGTESDVIVWDFSAKKELFRMEEHRFGINVVKFSRDDVRLIVVEIRHSSHMAQRFLVTVGNQKDGKVIIWDMKSGHIVGSINVAMDINAIDWGGRAKDIKRRPTTDFVLAASTTDGLLYLFTLTPSTGNIVAERINLGLTKRLYTVVRFSNDGDIIFGGSTSVCRCGITSLQITSQDELIVGGGDGSITAFKNTEPAKWMPDRKKTLPSPNVSMSKSYDDRELLVGCTNGDLKRIRVDSLDDLLVSENHSNSIVALAFPPSDSDRFVSASQDGTARVWDLSDYSQISKSISNPALPKCITVSEECIFMGTDDGKVVSYDAMSGRRLAEISHAHNLHVESLALSSNEKFIVSGGSDGCVRVWEVRSRQMIANLKEHTSRVTGIEIYQDNRHALTCSRDRSLLCWDLQGERRVSSHRQHMGGINDLSIVPALGGQSVVLTVGQEKFVTCWDLRAAQPIGHVELGYEALSVDVKSNGNQFVIAGSQNNVSLFEFRTLKRIATAEGHSMSVNKVLFSPDNHQVVSAGEDGCIFIWNIYDI